jgi:hypothetical protein
MNEIYLEKLTHQNIEQKIILSTDKDDPLAVDEYSNYRFITSNLSPDVQIHVGNLLLERIIEEDIQIFYLNTDNQTSFFSQLFMNQIGIINIEIWKNNHLLQTYYIEVESTKLSQEEVMIWIEKIQDIFPISNIGSDFSPMSNLRVNFTNKSGFFSFSSFSKELYNFLVIQNQILKRPGYLKRKFSVQSSLGSGGNIDPSKHHMWLNGKIKWKKTKPISNSLITRSAIAFEPINYPTKEKISNYNTDMNQVLLSRLIDAQKLITVFLVKCKKVDSNNIEVRNIQFQNKKNKLNLIDIIQKNLQLSSDLLQNIIYELKKMGVKVSNKSINYDARYIELTGAIISLDQFLLPLRDINSISNSLLAIPSTDMLFEYFTFALFVENLQAIGFEINDIGDDYPVPYFIRMNRVRDDAKITIFYDQTLPYITTTKNYHPLIDRNRSRSYKRPDFIFHINKDNFDSTFIADAKFKNLKNTMQRHFSNKLNSDNLVGKYTTGINQIGSLGLPPFFILGICLSDDVNTDTLFKSGMHEDINLFSLNSPITQSGALAIGYNSYQEIKNILSNAISFHDILSTKLPKIDDDLINFSRPEKDTTNITSQISRYEKNDTIKNWNHYAPTVNVEMAAEIKGMLLRGDKPQDIAFFFGINNGRISEIKNETTFKEIKAKDKDLPPSGPYPSVKSLLNLVNNR